MKKLSVVLATKNEEKNIAACLESIKDIADEIIILDERSTDRTRSIAKSFGAKVYEVDHEEIFHVTKQKAIEKATSEWVLQLDADEIVSLELAQEIKSVINMNYEDIVSRKPDSSRKRALFQRHQQLIEARDGTLGEKTGEIVAFFIPRRNLFIEKPLTYGGLYPDGVIRLIKQGKAYLPAKSVHEQMVIKGEVSWLFNDILHNDSPSLEKYLQRLNRYTDLSAKDFANSNKSKSYINILRYTFFDMPFIFCWKFFRRRGYKDGVRGFLWSLFSAWQYPLAYYKYYLGEYN